MWQSPPLKLGWQPDQVHVWHAHLRDIEPALLQALLSPDEQARAARFYFAKDRDRFVKARGILRLILGKYLNQPAQALRFQYSDIGKPSLLAASGDPTLCFNLSHAHQKALYAIAWNRAVGIDVEQLDATRDWNGIAERFFCPSERKALRQLSPELQLQGFFHAWTRKEALLKATGQGLTIPLEQVEVSLTPGAPAQLLSTGWDPSEVERWSIADLPLNQDASNQDALNQDYVAAVAAAGQGWQLLSWEFDLHRHLNST